MIIVVSLVLSVLLACLTPKERFFAHLVFFFIFTLPLCMILWRIEGFAFFYYAVNTVFGHVFSLVGMFYKTALGV